MLNDLFPSTQNIRLSENTNDWPTAIEMQFRQKFPDAENYVEGIEVKEIDAAKGAAIGFIKLTNNVKVPFVVNDHQLSPLNIAYLNEDTYRYLTPDTIKYVLSNVHPFQQIPRKDWKMLNNVTAIGKFASLDVPEEEVKNTLRKFAEYMPGKSALHNYVKPPSVVEFRLSKTASAKPVEIMADLEHVDNASIDEVSDFFGSLPIRKEAAIDQLINTGVFRIIKKDSKLIHANKSPHVKFDHTTYEPSKAGKFFTIDGWISSILYQVGHIPSQEGRDVCNEEAHIAVANNGVYVVDPLSFKHETVLGNRVPTLVEPEGRFGIAFGEHLYIFTKLRESREQDGYVVVDDNYQEWVLKLAHGVKRPYFDTKLHVVLFPKRISIYALNKKVKSIPQEFNKFAGTPIVVSSSNQGYSINDGGLSGMSPDKMNNLTRTNAISALMSIGVTEENAEQFLSEAATSGSSTFDIQDAEKNASYIVDNIKKASERFIKAAATKDQETIDDILALHLVTTTSLPKFRALIPRIDELSSDLSKLLLASRINQTLLPVDESKLTQALDALTDIKMELSRI